MSKVTIYGLEKYLSVRNDSIFKDMPFPAGLDKEVFADTVLLDAGEFGSLYGDPNYLKYAVTKWGHKYRDTFQKWADVWLAEYNPLHNFDRHEEYTDNGSNVSRTEQSNSANNSSFSSGSGENTLTVSAYDSADWSNKDKTAVKNSDTIQGSSNGTAEIKNTGSNETTHDGHLYGNIGVTTTQQMMASEVEARRALNPYQLMVDLFIQNFTIPVYD